VFSAADKLRIVQEADRCLASGERGALGALLRREGIYSSLLTSWRTHLGAHGASGLAAKKPGRKPKFTEAERLNVELTKRNAVLEKKLRIANALIALQKKAHEIVTTGPSESHSRRSAGDPLIHTRSASSGPPPPGIRRAAVGCRTSFADQRS
jgi:transposase-like protein